ncbi:MAG TPA: sugar phosphate isomerase/epimerase [Spongiibacteraceae bacterium]
MKGPAIFLAQFTGDKPPFDNLINMARWAASLGYRGIQVPTALIDLRLAATSDAYCSELKECIAEHHIEISELSTHLQGQLIATHPAYDKLFNAFAPRELHHNIATRTAWATEQLCLAAQASQRLRLKTHATFSGALLWQFLYPWPQRPIALVEEGFAELARRWLPILHAFDQVGVDVCYELHPGEDLHDGITFERFLAAVADHPRANILFDPSHLHLQHIDYLAFIDIYHERIKAFHVKDAEFIRNGRSGVYGGYQNWIDRAGRFRSLGDGQIDFKGIFSRLAQYDYSGWAVLEWECCIKNSEDSAREGATFIREHMIRKTAQAFDDFAKVEADQNFNRELLGLY